MTEIYLPLRSNAWWFEPGDALTVLDARLKNYVVFYDAIVPQGARLLTTVGEKLSITSLLPPGSGEMDRTQFRQVGGGPDATEFAFELTPTDGTSGPATLRDKVVAEYEVDFYPVLHRAGVVNESYVRWARTDLHGPGQAFARRMADQDRDDVSLTTVTPGPPFLRKAMVERRLEAAAAEPHGAGGARERARRQVGNRVGNRPQGA